MSSNNLLSKEEKDQLQELQKIDNEASTLEGSDGSDLSSSQNMNLSPSRKSEEKVTNGSDEPPKKYVQDFTLGKVIGEGSYGAVSIRNCYVDIYLLFLLNQYYFFVIF